MLWSIAAMIGMCMLHAVSAQPYPARPVTVIIPNAAGGPADVYGRALAVPMARHLGQALVIENIGGAGGNIGVVKVAKAAPDGYTILYHNMGMATNPALYRKLDYNPLTDFEYVGVVAYSTLLMVARRELPVADLKEFMAYAKTQGDRVTIADAGIGGPSGLCALLFQAAIGVKFTSVSYKGTAPALNDVLGGQVDLLCDSSSTAGRHATGGKVKALGVTSRVRMTTLPLVPTLEEGGLKGFEVLPWTGMYAPKNTPRPVIDRLVAALQAGLADADLISHYEKLGLQAASRELASSAGLQALLAADTAKWGALIKKAGIIVE
ncbi:MAG: tripartite tricarboxylate transporter substrate binding protein BugD [Betaproteobacteria bacterium]|nr:tripartite tricarboxylate transporter substrate binding protein BugD [Betaproteobacteria bacterium]